VPVATLSTWARRYGFPNAEDRPGKQRLFPVAHVERLRLAQRALAQGHRAAQVLSLSPAALRNLLALGPGEAAPRPAPLPAGDIQAALLEAVATLDGGRLRRLLLDEWARLTPLEFLVHRITPLLVAVGAKWQRHELGVHHEHFLSARLSDLLGELRQPLERDNNGCSIVLTTLPGERHTLGLSMAALVLAHAGLRTLFLGGECPPDEIARAVRTRHAHAAGISVSATSGGKRSEALLRELRRLLPRNVRLLVGGLGAAAPHGAERIETLAELAQWARRQRATGV
jgi:methanogenic corrinoid protein MtbC1